jgi:hypothetical protein
VEQQRNTLELEHQRRMMALELREQEVQVRRARYRRVVQVPFHGVLCT